MTTLNQIPPAPWAKDNAGSSRWWHEDWEPESKRWAWIERHNDNCWWAFNPWKDWCKPFPSMARAAYWAMKR